MMILNQADNICLGEQEVQAVYVGDQEIWSRSSGENERRGRPPLTFPSDGSNLLDWSITGAVGGVGDYGINYLNQTNVTVTNGQSESSWAAGTVSTTVNNTAPYIPNNTNPSQWLSTECSMKIGIPGGGQVGVDDRSAIYSHAQYKLTLPAGSYKFIFEGFDGSKEWKSDFLSRFPSTDGYQGNVFFALLDESNNRIAYQEIDRTQYSNDYFLHFEYPFTLSEETNLAVMFLSVRFNLRFMIVDSDVVAEPFEIQYLFNTITGVTCWEPFKCSIPVIISSGGQSQTINIDVNAPLGLNDTISKTSTGIDIPTYSGRNTISVNTNVVPSEVYVKFSNA